jgi:hypothetical protein
LRFFRRRVGPGRRKRGGSWAVQVLCGRVLTLEMLSGQVLNGSERLVFEFVEVAEPIGLDEEAGEEGEVVGAVEGETGVVAIELGDG